MSLWWHAIRPRTLVASLVPVAAGTALAHEREALDVSVALACAAAALLLQIAANLANDAFDALAGIDRDRRAGPVRITQAGLASPRRVLAATALAVALAFVPSAYLVAHGGWPILALGTIAALAAIGYSAGPFRLSSIGLGEVASFVFFGPVAVCGTVYLQASTFGGPELIAATAIGALTAAIMLVNNLRDRPTDAGAGKRTLVVTLGDTAGRRLYVSAIGVAFAALVPLAARLESPWPLLGLLALPLGARSARAIQSGCSGTALNSVLAQTARLDAVFGTLVSLGIAL